MSEQVTTPVIHLPSLYDEGRVSNTQHQAFDARGSGSWSPILDAQTEKLRIPASTHMFWTSISGLSNLWQTIPTFRSQQRTPNFGKQNRRISSWPQSSVINADASAADDDALVIEPAICNRHRHSGHRPATFRSRKGHFIIWPSTSDLPWSTYIIKTFTIDCWIMLYWPRPIDI